MKSLQILHTYYLQVLAVSQFFLHAESERMYHNSVLSSELTSECLFDLTTGTATSVNKGNLACGIFCTPRRARTQTEGGSDNTFVGQNSPFFLFFSLLSSFFIIN